MLKCSAEVCAEDLPWAGGGKPNVCSPGGHIAAPRRGKRDLVPAARAPGCSTGPPKPSRAPQNPSAVAIGGEQETSSLLDDMSPPSKQGRLVSPIYRAVPGAASNRWVWHGGHKHQTVTAFIRTFVPFLPAKRLHAERGETARRRAGSRAPWSGAVVLPVGLAWPKRGQEVKAPPGAAAAQTTGRSSEDCAVPAGASVPVLRGSQRRHSGSRRAGRPRGTRGYPLGNAGHLQGRCPGCVMVTNPLRWRSDVEEQEDS